MTCPVCGGDMYALKRDKHDYYICCRPSCACTYDEIEGYTIPSTAVPTVVQLSCIDFINYNMYADFAPLTSLEASEVIDNCRDIAHLIYEMNNDDLPF